jgi:HPt (histidine-containing phosphotransfer) domain-containing protein
MPNENERINLSYLESIAEGDRTIIKELVTIFLEQIPEFTEGLDKSFSEKKWLEMAAIAHKAKSSDISMGLENLGNRDLKNLELLAKELQVKTIKEKDNPDTNETEEAEKLTANLESYDKERQRWIRENALPEMMTQIIEKFKSTCKKAEEDLNSEIK